MIVALKWLQTRGSARQRPAIQKHAAALGRGQRERRRGVRWNGCSPLHRSVHVLPCGGNGAISRIVGGAALPECPAELRVQFEVVKGAIFWRKVDPGDIAIE